MNMTLILIAHQRHKSESKFMIYLNTKKSASLERP